MRPYLQPWEQEQGHDCTLPYLPPWTTSILATSTQGGTTLSYPWAHPPATIGSPPRSGVGLRARHP